MNPSPPKFFLWFLRWFCHPDLINYIEGDLLELFHEHVEEKGLRMAKWLYFLEVMKLLRRSIIRPVGGIRHMNHFGLFRHNLFMFKRVFQRDPVYGILNIFGITLGSAVFIFILQYTNFERSYDGFHTNNPNIYRIDYSYEGNGAARSFATSPPIFAPFFKENIPEIESFVRIGNAGEGTIAYQDRKFREKNILFADPGFFQIFSFPLIQGDSLTCLDGSQKIVISESMSKKYFRDENPIGKTIEVNSTKDKYTVTGVVKDIPANSHIQFDFLISYWWYDAKDSYSWYSHDLYSYVLLDSRANITSVDNKLQTLLETERGEINRQSNYKQSCHLQPLSDIHFNRDFEKELRPEKQGDQLATNTLFGIGCFILIMAWINYINLATSRTVKRAKEVGIRKTIGALRKQLIFQFLFESFLMNLGGLILAVLIVSVGLNNLNLIFGTPIDPNSILNVSSWSILLLVLIIGSLVTGVYPALLLSSFRPSKVLKPTAIIAGASGGMRKFLLTFQYGTSTGLIAATIVIFMQLNYLQDKDLGFDPNNLLVVNLPYEGKHKLFSEEITRLASVKGATLSEYIPGEFVTEPAHIQKTQGSRDEAVSLDVFHVGEDFFATLKIDLLAGRAFNEKYPNDRDGIILNETAVSQLEFIDPQEAIGETIVLNYKYPRRVIGVVKNFNQLTAKNQVSPMIYAFDPEWGKYCVIRCDNFNSAINEVEKLFQSIYPNVAPDYFILDGFYNRQYMKDNYFFKIVILFSGISIFIACMGVLGLTLYSVVKRRKEISLRRIFGASVSRIVYLISQENTKIIAFASLLSIPIIYYIMTVWLNTFSYRIEMHFIVFILACLILLTISILTSILIIFKTANSNPTNSLKSE